MFRRISALIHSSCLHHLLCFFSDPNVSFRNQESKTVVECDFGEGITNRVLSEDDEDEREDVASV